MKQVTADGTRSPFTDVSSILDNVALRKQLMQEMGRLGGLKGGKARAKKLNQKERSAIARAAASARWKTRSE
jgi:hypothetical protein